jgi:hypothetical protein
VAGAPDNNVAAVIYGKTKIKSKGVYTFCSSSDDGFATPPPPPVPRRQTPTDRAALNRSAVAVNG